MNKYSNPAIVISAHNRPNSLARILGSILRAKYKGCESVTLVISIDGGGDKNKELIHIANKFNWGKGEKIIIRHDGNLGLRNHILYCGDLSQKYGDIILLEDDLIVGPNFYIYAKQALNFYRDKKEIAGISLYSYRYNENANLPFLPAKSNSDIFFMQVPSSWGQAWTKNQWAKFREYYNTKPQIHSLDKLPENVKSWPESSWKKYFYKYIVDKNLYWVYPFNSMSSNCGEAGVHYSTKTNVLNVPLDYRSTGATFCFEDLEDCHIFYDAYFELPPSYFKSALFDDFGNSMVVDLYGTKQFDIFDESIWLTSKGSVRKIDGYDGLIFPIEENIFRDSKGDVFVLTEKKDIILGDGDEFRGKIIKNTYPLINNEIVTLNQEIVTLNQEVDNARTELFNKKREVERIYNSREWRFALKLQKITKSIFPKGSMRRRAMVGLFRLLRVFVRGFVRVKKEFFKILFLGEGYLSRFKSRKKRLINLNSKKLVYVDHSYHDKTKSNDFFLDYLKENFDVKMVFDESWNGGSAPDLSFVDESYLGVVFWQLIPSRDVIKKIKSDNIIFIPMYDQSGRLGYDYWRNHRDLKIVNFSSTLDEKLKKWSFDTMFIKYFPKPLNFTPGEKNEAFFWQRLTNINIDLIEKVLRNKEIKLHIHKVADPNNNFIKPTKEQENGYDISYSDWFETRSEMLDLVRRKGIYVAPREYEGIGLSFLEAMSMGKAVIAADNPTMNEYIEHGKNGYLFDLKNPRKINLDNIDEVQKNTHKYMRAGYEKWEESKHEIIEFIKKQ